MKKPELKKLAKQAISTELNLVDWWATVNYYADIEEIPTTEQQALFDAIQTEIDRLQATQL